MSHWRRLGGASLALFLVLVFGTIGYLILGFGVLDAVYQTVTTVSTVGFREVEELSPAGKVFTMVLILIGVGAAFYLFSVLIETFIEGRLNELLGRRRMEQSIASMRDHVVICGWGRVGRAIAGEVTEAGRDLVVIEIDPTKVEGEPHAIVGDATDDDALRAAGIDRAAALVAAVDSDAANSFIVLSAKALRPDLFIVARTRSQESGDKLQRAGADRVVNPQSIGGSRMAAFVLRPHVAEFLDVVMHERTLEFRLEEVPVTASSPIVGMTLRDSHLRDQTGALVLACATSTAPSRPTRRPTPRSGWARSSSPSAPRTSWTRWWPSSGVDCSPAGSATVRAARPSGQSGRSAPPNCVWSWFIHAVHTPVTWSTPMTTSMPPDTVITAR